MFKTHLGWSEDLLKVEQERAGMLQELTAELENVEPSLQRIPPEQRKTHLQKMFVHFGECVLKHDELVKKTQQPLALFESTKLTFQNILNYKKFLKLSHDQLIKNRQEFFSKIDQMSGSVQNVPLQMQRQTQSKAPIASSQLENSQGAGPESAVDYTRVQPDDAFLLDTTLKLHENAKASIDTNQRPEMRMDLASLLLSSSSGKDLTWPNIEFVFDLWGKCFANKTMGTDPQEQVFKEMSHRLKRGIDNHLETNVSAAESATEPRVSRKLLIDQRLLHQPPRG